MSCVQFIFASFPGVSGFFFFFSHFIYVPSLPLGMCASLSSLLFYLSKERDPVPFQVPGMRIRMWAGSLGGNGVRRWEMLPLQNQKPNSSGSQGRSFSKGILLSSSTKDIVSNGSPTDNYNYH